MTTGSFGLQQVLQLSSAVERAQMAQQAQASEQARGFDRELEKLVDHQRDQTQETKGTENAKIRDEDQRKPKHYARRLPKKPEEEEEKEKEEAAPPSETGQGGLINVVA